MRRFAALLLLASCGGPPVTNDSGAPDSRIECRALGEAQFTRTCTVESADTADGRLITIRKADGGFRRLRVTTDGSGIVAADGAERAHLAILPGNRIEVEIGGDRFRLPARVRGQ